MVTATPPGAFLLKQLELRVVADHLLEAQPHQVEDRRRDRTDLLVDVVLVVERRLALARGLGPVARDDVVDQRSRLGLELARGGDVGRSGGGVLLELLAQRLAVDQRRVELAVAQRLDGVER